MTRAGSVEPRLGSEFPGLGIRYEIVERGSGRSPRDVKRRLGLLSDRFTGGDAVNMRHRPIPWAYRVFFRHIGLDPDRTTTPVEGIVLDRMKHGGFRSVSLLDDALTIATMETGGVAVRAFDAERVTGTVGVRATQPGEELEGRPGELPPGTLVIADTERPIALLFGAVASGRGVRSKTRRTLVVAIQVEGVPDAAVEEALWLVREVMQG